MISSGRCGSAASAPSTAPSVRSALNAGITTLTLWPPSALIPTHPTHAPATRHPENPGPPDRVGERCPPTRPNAGRGRARGRLAWRADLASWSLHARREARDDHRPRLRRAEPRARPLPRPAAHPLGARRRRRVRPPRVGGAADHRARVVLHDVEPDARRPRHLRLPQPRRPLLRRPLHRQRRGRQGAAPVGHPRPARQAQHRARRARHVPGASRSTASWSRAS